MSDIPEIIVTCIEAAAVVAASGVAIVGVNAWRRELIGKRKAELAEETLAMFYEARDLIEWVRNPGSFGGEGASRPRESGKEDEGAVYKDSLYVPVERLLKRSEFWGKFDAAKYRYRAIFGGDASRPFDDVRTIRNRILISSNMLIRTVGREHLETAHDNLRRQREKWEKDIGWGVSDGDEIRATVDDAIAGIEEECRPAIVAVAKSASLLTRLTATARRILKRADRPGKS